MLRMLITCFKFTIALFTYLVSLSSDKKTDIYSIHEFFIILVKKSDKIPL